MIAFAVFAGLAAVSFALTHLVRRGLLRRDILDIPNHRSSHKAPVPRGGGLAVMAALLPAWVIISLTQPVPGLPLAVAGGAAALAALSLVDDIRSLPAGRRLAVQALAVAIGLYALPDGSMTGGWLPQTVEWGLAFVAWLWFVNLYNFMDGIDGISGTQTLSICLGVGLLALAAGQQGTMLLAVAVAAAAAGFLALNWHPARIFLGDVGSVPLGYVLGWLLLSLAMDGQWVAALVIPAYYLGDATLTLLARALRGENVAKAHREHSYQLAAAGTGDHARVVGIIAVGNAALLAIAILLARHPLPALALAAATVAAMLGVLARMAHAPDGQPPVGAPPFRPARFWAVLSGGLLLAGVALIVSG